MFRLFCFRFALLLMALASLSLTQAAEPLEPEITAQGFEIAETQEGLLGQFSRIRVRFEAPDRIAELYVRERSYEVDLAKTPEMAHLPLFGLKAQVRSLTDVTLNFQDYINQKIEAEGLYTFELRVTDRKGRSASARLLVQVVALPPQEQHSWNEAVETVPFRFVRVGASPVSGVDEFGITWRTIESNAVVIEVTRREGGASRLTEMTLADYDDVRTKGQLARKTAGGADISVLNLATAGGRAAGTVFGVINDEVPYLLKVTGSDTSLSEPGTTVTLVGEYKR